MMVVIMIVLIMIDEDDQVSQLSRYLLDDPLWLL